MLFAIPYIITDALCSAARIPLSIRSHMLLAAPYILQAYIAAIGDWYTWKLAERVYGTDTPASTFTILLQLTNPWQFYISPRPFSNSLETTLTVAALAHWPWQWHAPTTVKENTKTAPINLTNLRIALLLAATAVLLRPTNIFIWLTVSLSVISTLRFTNIAVLAREALLCGSVALAVSILADRYYFGFWTFPPYNWLYFNVSKSLAVFYGRHPWHYYLVQGIPLLCTTSLPFVVPALYRPRSPSSDSPSKTLILRTLASTVFVTVATLSLIAHKEVRFIYPLLPILSILGAPHAASFFTARASSTSQSSRPQRVLRHKAHLAAGLTINIFLAGYLSYFHQRAPLKVLNFLRDDYEQRLVTSSPPASDELFALFLMPCHSTPWRSHLIHPSLNAYALSCDPPLHTQPNTPERINYMDEADRFYAQPEHFLSQEIFNSTAAARIPRYIVGFEGIEPTLHSFFTSKAGSKFKITPRPAWSSNNGLFSEDWRRAGKVIVWATGHYDKPS
ncbi:hypothetical protein VHEMI07747 [[Torrubiella] hemipterigena]|nr:hypothetical protein VHEMI07747 [[Torrubiella] hemipterigena]